MYWSECAANKPGEREWQDHWVKCSTTVSLEPPHAPLLQSPIQSGDKISSDDLMLTIQCRVRRDEHNGEDWFCETERIETAWSGSAAVISRKGN